MHRIEGTYYTTDSDGNKIFQDTEENKTLTTAAWLNSVQEEICNLITGLGGTIGTENDDTSQNQIITLIETYGISIPLHTKYLMSGNITFTDPGYGWGQQITIVPDAARNVDPSGTFRDGYIISIVSITALWTCTFDSGGIAAVIQRNECSEFIYSDDAGSWYKIV
jgi:hypothetical protein